MYWARTNSDSQVCMLSWKPVFAKLPRVHCTARDAAAQGHKRPDACGRHVKIELKYAPELITSLSGNQVNMIL